MSYRCSDEGGRRITFALKKGSRWWTMNQVTLAPREGAVTVFLGISVIWIEFRSRRVKLKDFSLFEVWVV